MASEYRENLQIERILEQERLEEMAAREEERRRYMISIFPFGLLCWAYLPAKWHVPHTKSMGDIQGERCGAK